MISLDNNAAERALRRPVVTRKNAYGSRNQAGLPKIMSTRESESGG